MTVWERRDLPVLQALASDDPDLRGGFLEIDESGENPLGLDLAGGEFHDAILTLRDAGYVEGDLSYAGGPTAHFAALYVTGRGLQALGEWPLFDEIASPGTLALLLERLAEEAPSGEAGNFRRAARYARSLGATSLRAAAVGALAHVARIGLGLG